MLQNLNERAPWMVSLHGGHSGDFCDHASGTLHDMLEAAVQAGYHTFGVSEHVPRTAEKFLYDEEREMGWTVEKIAEDFERYARAIQFAVDEFAGRLIVLRGFENEVVPTARYVEETTAIRDTRLPDGRRAFDYFVGSVHFVDEYQIDGPVTNFVKAAEYAGGPERLAIRYYDTIGEMVERLRPDVVGHLDLIKKNWRAAGFSHVAVDSLPIRAAAERVMEAVRANGGILDLNTAGWRKGLDEPYPAPWIVERAQAMGIGFCFGDDSHRPTDVGAGMAEARKYLLRNGTATITVLTRNGDDSDVTRRVVPLT